MVGCRASGSCEVYPGLEEQAVLSPSVSRPIATRPGTRRIQHITFLGRKVDPVREGSSFRSVLSTVAATWDAAGSVAFDPSLLARLLGRIFSTARAP